MSASLPEFPSLENLSKRAKAILKAHRNGEPVVCDLLRRLGRFANATPETILATEIRLSDVQFALALAHGFENWAALKRHVEGRAEAPKREAAALLGLGLHGDGHRQDSCSLVLSAAAGALGRPIDYETAFALSTNGYALGIVPGNGGECPAWWHMSGRHHGMAIVAKRAGLQVERLDLPPLPAAVWTNPQAQLERRRQYAHVVRRELEAGRVVVTAGGWDWQWQLPRLTPHVWWGVILEAREDGTIRGACLNGREDNPIAILTDETWAISAGAVCTDARETDITMLERARDRILGNRNPFRRPDIVWQPVFGLAAMETWIEQFGRVPFCVECVDRSASCARCLAIAVFEGARGVCSYLTRRLDSFGAPARRAMESLIARYSGMAEMMEPFVTSEAGCGYQAILGDVGRQREHIERVLRPVRSDLEGAAEAIGEVLRVVGGRRSDG